MLNGLPRMTTVIATLLTITGTSSAADDLVIMAGHLPPMIDNSGEGREAEIIVSVMERCGHNVTFQVQPFTRHWKSYEQGKGDGVATVPHGMPLPGSQSETYIQYQNGVSYLASKTEGYADLKALAGQSVVAFMGASSILPSLQEASASFKSYREIADQISQSRLIFGGRIDAVIGDGMIFAEYNRQLKKSSEDLQFDPNQDIVFNATFEPSSYAVNFRSEEITDDFNRCYQAAHADGTIDAINKKWVERYRDTLGGQYLGY